MNRRLAINLALTFVLYVVCGSLLIWKFRHARR